MDKQDRIIASLAILSLVIFMGVLVGFVREPDLSIIVVFGLGLGAYDFWRTYRKGVKKNGNGKVG